MGYPLNKRNKGKSDIFVYVRHTYINNVLSALKF